MLCHCGGHHRRSNLLRELQKGSATVHLFGVPDDRHRRCRVRCGDQDLGSAYAAGPGASQRRVNEYARLAAALEATGDPIASVGYGIAYPFGVLGVVLFVQVLPTLLKTDVRGEVAELEGIGGAVERRHGGIAVENLGIFSFAIALAVGVWLGGVKIPLGQGATFSLGVSGGPLLTGLLVGHFGHIGPISLETKKSTMETLRELGLAWFLLGAGTEAGQGFVEVVKEQGFVLFIYGAADDAHSHVGSFPYCKKTDENGDDEYAWLHLRRHDQYAGAGFPDRGGGIRCGSRGLCGNLSDRVGVRGAIFPVRCALAVKNA